MYKRKLETELQALAKGYPVITVIGPRQSGKTTLVKNAFPQKNIQISNFLILGNWPRKIREDF